MHSRDLVREIRKRVWPALQQVGFATFAPRTAWRHTADTIDVVNFLSFPSHHAAALGVTTFSFRVCLGSALLYVPPIETVPLVEGVRMPTDAHCPMRGALHAGNLAASRDASIWSVAKDGANLTVCFDSVLERLPEGMQWFRRISDRREVLRILIEDDEDLMSLWGFGNKPSPTRSYLTGYVARALGNTALAKRELDAAVTSKCFDGLFATVDEALRRT